MESHGMNLRVYGRVTVLVGLLATAAVLFWPPRDVPTKVETGASQSAATSAASGAAPTQARTPGRPDSPAGTDSPAASAVPSQAHAAIAQTPGASDASAPESKPVPTLAHVQRFFESQKHPAIQATAQRMRDMEHEPEDGWSQDTEARLRSFVASQPDAARVESVIACRVRGCMVQLSDMKLTAGDPPPVAQTIFYNLTRQSWFSLLLEHDSSQFLVIEGRPAIVGFFVRVQ